jgi:hypothetical protein
MLCKHSQEVADLEHMHVFFEILVVMGMKENPSLKPFIVDLLQGDRRTGHILGKAITGALIENSHTVVYAWSFAPLTARPCIRTEA